ILITHKLKETYAITNRVLVLRSGQVAGGVDDMSQQSASDLVHMMCGREVTAPTRPPSTVGQPLLAVDVLETRTHGGMPPKGVSVQVRAGEILGIAGISGNGQGALAAVLAGVLPFHTGAVRVAGRPLAHPHPRALQALGVGRIPEDRMTAGLITALPLADSMI